MVITSGQGIEIFQVGAATSILKGLGQARADALKAAGFESLHDVLTFKPFMAAQSLLAAARSGVDIDAKPLLTSEFHDKATANLGALPVIALQGMTRANSQALTRAGVSTLSDIIALLSETEALLLSQLNKDNGFFERPSAPAELMPQVLGAIANSVGFSSFIRDTVVHNLAIESDAARAPQSSVSGVVTGPAARNSLDEMRAGFDSAIKRAGISSLQNQLAKVQSFDDLLNVAGRLQQGKPRTRLTLGSIFQNQVSPEIGLGYIVTHVQNWIGIGTALGEVKHTLPLSAGEPNNIARVRFVRQQTTGRVEDTEAGETLNNTFSQTRAVDEITSVVAREHQFGGTNTEASTSATAVSVVGSLAIGASLGATIGTVVAPGVGTVVGGALGAAVSGAIGAGLTASSSSALGTLRSDTSGDRTIVAETQQQIQLITNQAASATRSLFSTVVVTDSQNEDVEATSSNITNYNHMHTLNLLYFEVLQRYLVTIEPRTVQPIIIIPYTFLDFLNFSFARDYWHIIRDFIDDEGMIAQGDLYFVDEGIPSRPDLEPEPPEPTPPDSIVRDLKLQLMWSLPNDRTGSVTLRVFAKIGTNRIEAEEFRPGGTTTIDTDDSDGVAQFDRFYLFPDLKTFDELRIEVEVERAFGGALKISLAAQDARIEGNGQVFVISNENIGSFTVGSTVRKDTFPVRWNMPDTSSRQDRRFAADSLKRQRIIQHNAAKQAAFDALQADIERFRNRLERHLLRRRYALTRAVLMGLEPEELIDLMRSLSLKDGNPRNGGTASVPISEIADTMPVGFVTGGVMLRLLRKPSSRLRQHLAGNDPGIKLAENLKQVLTYADEVQTHFEKKRETDPIVSSQQLYVPTGGLFVEGILGRANTAEYLDQERYFNWHEAPIPNAGPGISDISTDSRFQAQPIAATVPNGNLTVINPQNLPEPAGAGAALAAVQNGAIFRDLSGQAQIGSIITDLSALSGKIAESAAGMTGTAQTKALELSGQLAQAALKAAASPILPPDPPKTETQKGIELSTAAKLDEEIRRAGEPPQQNKQKVFKKQAKIPDPPVDPVETTALFSFIFNSTRGTELGSLFTLEMRKDGLSATVDGLETQLDRTIPDIRSLDFSQTGLSQLPVKFENNRSPFLLSLLGDVQTFGARIDFKKTSPFMLPENLANYIFEIVPETEQITVSANSKLEAEAALKGEIGFDIGIGGDGAATSAPTGGAGTSKPKLSKKPKLLDKLKNVPTSLPGMFFALAKEVILPSFTAGANASGGASGSVAGSVGVSVAGTFVFDVPTGEFDIKFLEQQSR